MVSGWWLTDLILALGLGLVLWMIANTFYAMWEIHRDWKARGSDPEEARRIMDAIDEWFWR